VITTPANATVVDWGKLYDNGGERWWRVTVRTPPGWPRREVRVYTISAYTDTLAAREGLKRFSQEVDGRPCLIVEG